MKLRGWHVEGFGLLHDFRVEDLPSGLTVVLGPNEAGKTSLLAFIRGALFGFPDRRKKERQYPPLRGGRHGGRLFLESDGAIYTVERFASPAHLAITQPDGALGTEADLRRILGGVDAELHRNVFAFSLSELQKFETLQVEGVRDLIFAAGVVGAGRSARTAIDAFAARRADVGKKRGECLINNLRRRVEELDKELQDARARAVRHPELRRSADALEEQLKDIGRELSNARREMADLDVILGAWPDWDERSQAEAELARLGGGPDLPEDLGTRLDAALAAYKAKRERYEERIQAAIVEERELATLMPNERLFNVAGEVGRLAALSVSVRARRERIRDVENEMQALRKRAEEQAPRLGAGWTLQAVRAFDTSIPAAQEIADWGHRLRAADEELTRSEAEAFRLKSAADDLSVESSRRTEELADESQLPDTEELKELDGAIRRLRSTLSDLAALRASLKAANQRVSELARRATEARVALAAKESELRGRVLALGESPEPPPLAALACSQQAIRELRSGIADLTAARADLRTATLRASDAKQRADDAALSVATKEAELVRRETILGEARPVPDGEALRARERMIRDLRLKLIDLDGIRRDLRAAQARSADQRRDAHRRSTGDVASSSRRTLFIAAAIMMVGAVVLGLASQPVAAVVALGASLLAALVAARSSVAASTFPDDAASGPAETEGSVHELQARIAELEGVAVPLARGLGFSGLPGQGELEAKGDECAVQFRARLECDREAAGLSQLRMEIQQLRSLTKHLEATAATAQADIVPVESRRVLDLEAASLTIAHSLGFAELPTNSALEEKDAAVGSLIAIRRERDLEASALRALESVVGRDRDALALQETELSDARRDVSVTEAVHVNEAELLARALAREIGFPDTPGDGQLETKAKQIDEQLRERQFRTALVAESERLRRRATAAITLADGAKDAAITCRGDRDALYATWSAWKARNGCPTGLRPETAQQFFESVERLRESLARLDELGQEAARGVAEIQDFSKLVQALVEQAGMTGDFLGLVAEDALDGLSKCVEADRRTRSAHDKAASELEKTRTAAASAERGVGNAEKEVKSVYEEAGASDETDCRARIATSLQRTNLRNQIREAERRLRTRLGAGPSADAIRAELAGGDCQGWESRKQDCKNLVASLHPRHEQAVRAHQSAVEECSALERECDVVALATEREGVVAEIREAVVEWRRLAIAQSLVQETLRRYEVERQPSVLMSAAESFARVTEGRYTRLVTRDAGVDLIAANGSRLDAVALSRGAAEQLYLCLRLALASEFGRMAVQLPLVMDDVLVNFDPDRARLAAELLLSASANHQVLLFTCHPETVDLLVRLDPKVNIIRIQRETPTPGTGDPPVLEDGSRSRVPAGGTASEPSSTLVSDDGEAVLAALRAAGRPLSRADLVTMSGLAEERWTPVIQALRTSGQVIPHGRKRGTTWGLPEWEGAAEE